MYDTKPEWVEVLLQVSSGCECASSWTLWLFYAAAVLASQRVQPPHTLIRSLFPRS